VLADNDETPRHTLLELVERPIAPTDLFIRDELQRERVRQRGGQFAEHLRLHQRGHLHVLRAARVEPVALATWPELLGFARHHVKVPVEDRAKLRSGRVRVAARVDECARLAVGFEPLHSITRTDEVEDEVHSGPKLLRPIRSRRHRQQGDSRSQEGIQFHPVILPQTGTLPYRSTDLLTYRTAYRLTWWAVAPGAC